MHPRHIIFFWKEQHHTQHIQIIYHFSELICNPSIVLLLLLYSYSMTHGQELCSSYYDVHPPFNINHTVCHHVCHHNVRMHHGWDCNTILKAILVKLVLYKKCTSNSILILTIYVQTYYENVIATQYVCVLCWCYTAILLEHVLLEFLKMFLLCFESILS